MQSFRIKVKLILLLLAVLFCSASLTYANSSCQFNKKLTDWITTDDPCNICSGHYTPFYEPIENFTQRNDIPILVDFDSGEFHQRGLSTIHQARLRQGLRWIEADQLKFVRTDDDWYLESAGNLTFHQPNMSLWGETAFYNNQNAYFSLTCGEFRWYPRHVRAYGESIEGYGQEKIILYDTYFTTCPPTQDTWGLSAEKITLYPKKGRAHAKHISLSTHKVPVFYWPYLNYPIDDKRHSGFLFPSYGSSSQSGLMLTIPYYLNLAPNYDLTLSLKGFSKRGVGIQSHFRYLTRQSNGELNIDYVPDDRAYQRFHQDTLMHLPSGYSPSDPRVIGIRDHDFRLGLVFNHHIHIGSAWLIDLQYHRVSDDNFFVDLGNDIHTTSTIHLPQRLQAFYQGENWYHTFRLESYQVLQPFKGTIIEEIYRRAPQWAFSAYYPDTFSIFQFNMTGEMVRFSHPGSPITRQHRVEGDRFHLLPSVSVPFVQSWGALTPTFYLDMLTYDLKQPVDLLMPIDTHPNRLTPIYTIDGKLNFERSVSIAQRNYTQTLTPRAFYTYVPYRDQRLFPIFDSGAINFSYAQLYRYNRFSGKDRLNEANQLSLSLTSSLISQDDSFEWARLSLGQILYFTKEKVFLCESNIPSQLCSVFNAPRTSEKHSNLLSEFIFFTPQDVKFGAFVEWGINEALIQQASLFLHTKIKERIIFNANYFFTRRDIKVLNDTTSAQLGKLDQGDISLMLPVSQRVNLLSRIQYDFSFDQVVELLGGIEYDSCCFATQVLASRYRQLGNAILGRDYSNQIMLQFVFKGLSNIGINQSDKRLKQKIPGFVPLSERVALPKLGPASHPQ